MKRYRIIRFFNKGNEAINFYPNNSTTLNKCVEFIKSLRLPYITKVWTGTYTQSDCVAIVFSLFVEDAEKKELEGILSDWVDDQNARLLKYHKKLTTFLPSHSWSR